MTNLNNEKDEVASTMAIPESPDSVNKLSYDRFTVPCPTCKKPIEVKEDPWGSCPHCGARY